MRNNALRSPLSALRSPANRGINPLLQALLCCVFLLTHVNGSGEISRSLPERAQIEPSADGQSWVRSAGIVERGLDRAHWVLEAGSGNDQLEIPVAADSVLQRSVIKLQAREEGFAPLLSWEGVGIAAEYTEGYWTLFYQSAGTAEWQASEFSVYGAESPVWLNLDIVRTGGDFVSGYLIFINGAQIAHIETYDKSAQRTPASSAKFSQLPFADVKLTDVAHMKDYPAYVTRALQSLRRPADEDAEVSEESGATAEKKVTPLPTVARLTDAERKMEWSYPQIRINVAPGDLSFQQEAWFLTETVNRSYFRYTEDFRLERAQRDEVRLEFWGADYLPTLESRSWAAPVRYADWADQYIEKIYGYIVPELSGEYHFWISGDEEGALFFSESGDPAELALMASFNRPTSQYQWNSQPAQRSQAIYLEAGVPHYFEAWHVEKTGADHFAVAWSLPGESTAIPGELIGGRVLSAYSAGMPGNWPRELHFPDISLLPDPATLGSPGGARARKMAVVINGAGIECLRGDQYILIQDYTTGSFDDEGGWLYHAYQDNGNGIGWTFSDVYSYPSIYSNDLGWIWYQSETANPQIFFRFGVDVWLYYFASTTSYHYNMVNLPRHWSFEGTQSDWVNDTTSDNKNWYENTGGTSSAQTGPSNDHTFGNSSGKYMYFETSSGGPAPGGAFTSGDHAHLVGPPFAAAAGGTTLSFYYHMYGSNTGSLHVDRKIGSQTSWTTIWTRTGQQQTSSAAAWLRADVNIGATAGQPVVLRIRAVAAGGYLGDIALDDIYIYPNGVDSDGDGLLDSFEVQVLGTNPTLADTDGDGMPDGWEYMHGFNPKVYNSPSADADGDGLSNYNEYLSGTNPNKKDHPDISLVVF